MKEFLLHFKNDKILLWLTIVVIACFGILAGYWLSRNTPELFEGAGDLYTMFCNIVYGYIASYFFYILNIAYPEYKNQKVAYKNIAIALAKIECNIGVLSSSYGLEIYPYEYLSILTRLKEPDLFPTLASFYSDNIQTLLGYPIQGSPNAEKAQAAMKLIIESEDILNEEVKKMLGYTFVAAGLTIFGYTRLLSEMLANASTLPKSEQRFLQVKYDAIPPLFRQHSSISGIKQLYDLDFFNHAETLVDIKSFLLKINDRKTFPKEILEQKEQARSQLNSDLIVAQGDALKVFHCHVPKTESPAA